MKAAAMPAPCDEPAGLSILRKIQKILLKMSGEILQGDREYGIKQKTMSRIAQDVREVVDLGVEVYTHSCRKTGMPRGCGCRKRDGPGNG